MADSAAQLAPTGKLRVAIAIAPSPSAQFAIKDAAGHYRGVAIILGQPLAKKLGVPVELIAHNGSGEIQNSAAANKWGVAFLPVDEERKKFVDFGNAYPLLQSTYLVGPSGKIASGASANTAGVRIGGVANTATFRTSNKTAPNATHVSFDKPTPRWRRCATGKWTRWRSRASRSPGWRRKCPARAFSTAAF